MTTSSYASTATPPKIEKDLGLSLGGDFSDMFSGFGNRKSVVLESNDNRARSHSPVSRITQLDTFFQTNNGQETFRVTTQNRYNQPAPLSIDKAKPVEASPYSWSSQHSHDGLMSNTSPPPFAPRQEERAPPVPQHSYSRPQRPGAPADTGLRRSSGLSAKRQSTFDSMDAVDEDARLLRESVNASRRLNNPEYSTNVRDSWALPSTSSYSTEDTNISKWAGGSVETTPRARKPVPKLNEDDLFDDQMAASADVAHRFQEKSLSPPSRNAAPQNKVMTPAQFERYKQDQERLRSVGGQSKDDEDEDEEETYDDDEDEAEKNKQLAKQRRKQEAHMAVYRQQMMKVTGEAPTGPPTARPSLFGTQSSPNLALPSQGQSSSDSNEEEDEEVPLAILQAHGFPNKNKPPMRSMGSNPNLRASTQPSGNPADPRLPVFARHLPQDPYFGASVATPLPRESLAFGGGGGGSVAGSVHGAPSRGLPPGGLVGVIATEERSRAMRRGSPNPQGDYGPPSNGFNGMGMPPNQRSSTAGSMMNGMMPGQMGQMGPMGPMNPMMLTPGDQAQIQMSQQMQQFMQMQMQFMQMMTTGQGQGQGQGSPQPNGHMSQQSLGSMPRPASPLLRPGSAHHQRAMTMLEPNAAPWMQNGHNSMYAPSIHAQGGYAPSIAPSERSNIGLPGRYRPVSHAPPSDNKSRTSTMTGALQGWENKNGSTVKAVKKSGNASDEDDEEGWEEMAKKREKKKSKWRSQKGESNNGLKDMLGYA